MRAMGAGGSQGGTADDLKGLLATALSRGAQRSSGLPLSDIDHHDQILPLTEAVDTIEETDLILWLMDEGGKVGFARVNAELRSALIEMKISGRVFDMQADERLPTSADGAIVRPVLGAVFDQILERDNGGPMAKFLRTVVVGTIERATRKLILGLEAGDYRQLSLTMVLGDSDRQGAITLILPPHRVNPEDEAKRVAEDNWSKHLTNSVSEAPANLHAVLHRHKTTYADVRELKVGTVLGLSGVSLDSIRLETIDGTAVLSGRLGQLSGMRAVRIGAPEGEGDGAVLAGTGDVPQLMDVGMGDSPDFPVDQDAPLEMNLADAGELPEMDFAATEDPAWQEEEEPLLPDDDAPAMPSQDEIDLDAMFGHGGEDGDDDMVFVAPPLEMDLDD